MAYPAAPPPGWSDGRRPVRVWDIVLTIVLLILLVLLALLTSYFALFLGMMSDPCGGTVQCDFDRIGVGVLTALIAPPVLALLAIVVSIVLLVRRRLAFWVPLVAAPLVIGSWFLGAVIASGGVPQ